MEPVSNFAAFIMSTISANRINIVRILEAVIIAGLTATVLKYSSIDALVVKVDIFGSKIEKVEDKVEQMRRDFYEPRRH